MILRLKLFPFRYLLFLFPLLFLGLIYKDAVFHWLLWDPNAPDLQGVDAGAIKQHILIGLLSLTNALLEYNFYQSFLFPILSVVLAYYYTFFQQRYLKYYIGRSALYSKAVWQVKWQLILYPVCLFLSILTCLVAVGVAVQAGGLDQLDFYFSPHSVLRLFGTNTWTHLLYYSLVKIMAIIVNSLLLFSMVDYFSSFIKTSLLYLIFIWALSPILYAVLPYYFVPMTSLMTTSYGEATLPILFAPYIAYLALFAYMKATKKYEVF